MNLSYLKYAVEVEKTGSITKAAQNFYMNQPHLSKIIRELERELGEDIFDRTSRGMPGCQCQSVTISFFMNEKNGRRAVLFRLFVRQP